MSKLSEQLVSQIQKNGWMSISSLTFDNLSVANVVMQSGAIGIDTANNLCIFQSNEDIVYTQIIENKAVTFDKRRIGHMKTIVFQDLDCLQWFQAAQYTFNYTYENPAKTFDDMANHPWPITTYPSEADILSATFDEETGLWTCPNVATALDTGALEERSVIPLFEEEAKTMSSAIVSEWFIWYTQHNLFKDYINSQFGLTII